MKRIALFISLILICTYQVHSQSVLDYVDLFICTSGDHGQLDPAATVPFGMVKLGPDTYPVNHSGYNYEADKILGFSHNRIGGVGCEGAGGNLRILPGVGNLNSESASFNKDSEKAFPGYYSVKFSNGIQVELAATSQTGIHQYTYPKSDSAYVVVDTGSSFSKLVKCSSSILNDQEFYVSVTAKNVCNDGKYTVHYHIWCNKKLELAKKKGHKLYFQFQTAESEPILFYVTASSISPKDAKAQWESESRELSFNEVVKDAREKWGNLLSRILVEGKEEYKTLFYTHLYHQFLNPVKAENQQKQFRAADGKIYQSTNYTHYDTWSMWDNFRNKFSLFTLIAPEISKDIAISLIDLYKYGKPNRLSKNSPVPTVRNEHTGVVLLDLYNRGITGFDLEPFYNKLGVAVKRIKTHSPDKVLEKSYDYWALAQFASLLDKDDESAFYKAKSDAYKPVWRDKFLPITEKSDVMHGDGLYEGTLWQYRWSVQFDIDGMIEMIGGKGKYTEQLEYFFNNHLYNHGNQPDLHVPFLFNYGTKPWLTQKWVNQILTKEMVQHYGTHKKWEEPYVGRIYKAEPEGYIPEMDDDDGTMSAWYVLSSMGMYPVELGKPEFQISTPIFNRIVIKLEGDKTFEIVTKNLSETSFYIQSATLNGEPLNRTFLTQEELLGGGKLIFNLSETPNDSWIDL